MNDARVFHVTASQGLSSEPRWNLVHSECLGDFMDQAAKVKMFDKFFLRVASPMEISSPDEKCGWCQNQLTYP